MEVLYAEFKTNKPIKRMEVSNVENTAIYSAMFFVFFNSIAYLLCWWLQKQRKL